LNSFSSLLVEENALVKKKHTQVIRRNRCKLKELIFVNIFRSNFQNLAQM